MFEIFCVYDRGHGKIRMSLGGKGPVQKVCNGACVRCLQCSFPYGMHCEEFIDAYVLDLSVLLTPLLES